MAIKDIINKNSKVWTPKLEKYLDSMNDKEHSDKFERSYEKGLHPSQISGCIRATIYKRLKADYVVNKKAEMARVDPKSRRIFDNGSGVHERLQAYFRDMNVLLGRWYCKACGSIYPQRSFEEEMTENLGKKYGDKDWNSYLDSPDYVFENLLVPVPENCPHCNAKLKDQFSYSEVPIRDKRHDLEGYTDGVAYCGDLPLEEVSKILREDIITKRSPVRKDLWILEFKSENSMKFRKHTTAHEEHIFQAYCYALGLDINKIAVIYEAKDTQEIMEDDIIVTEEGKQKVLSKIAKIRECERREIIPEPDDTTKCTYCNYKNLCISNIGYQDIQHQVQEILEDSKKEKPAKVKEKSKDTDFDIFEGIF